MQISNSLTLPSLTVSLEQQRESAARMTQTVVPFASQIGEDGATLYSVEQVKQAEEVLQRQRSRPSFSQVSDDPRTKQALSSYQSVQSSQERDYVSEVLGIDVYA